MELLDSFEQPQAKGGQKALQAISAGRSILKDPGLPWALRLAHGPLQGGLGGFAGGSLAWVLRRRGAEGQGKPASTEPTVSQGQWARARQLSWEELWVEACDAKARGSSKGRPRVPGFISLRFTLFFTWLPLHHNLLTFKFRWIRKC